MGNEKKIEIPFGAKDSELQEATYFIPKGFHAEIDDDKIVIKKGEKPTAWSEEDEKIITGIINDIQKRLEDYPLEQLAEIYFKEIKWLKSLKQRYTWRPSEEQMNALSVAVKHGQTDDPDTLKKMLEQLKKLREE